MVLKRSSLDFKATASYSEIDLAVATVLCHQSKSNDRKNELQKQGINEMRTY